MSGTDVIFLRNPIFSPVFSSKILWELNASQVSYLEMQTVTPDPGNISDSMQTGSKAIKVNGHM